MSFNLIREKSNNYTWASVHNYTRIIAHLLKEHDLANWKPEDTYQRTILILHRKIRTNLVASLHLLHMMKKNPEFFLTLAVIYRTMLSDIIIFKYRRTIRIIAGQKGFAIEMDALECQYTAEMKKMHNTSKKKNPDKTKELDEVFKKKFGAYLNKDGKVKNASAFYTSEFKNLIKKYRDENNITVAHTEKESGKLDFLASKHKEDWKNLMSYFSMYHHFTGGVHVFYEGDLFEDINIDCSTGMVMLMFEVYVDLFHDLDNKHPILPDLIKTFQVMQLQRHIAAAALKRKENEIVP